MRRMIEPSLLASNFSNGKEQTEGAECPSWKTSLLISEVNLYPLLNNTHEEMGVINAPKSHGL